jgi:deoxyadenosine/deoxycytidine kinase
MSTRIYCVDGNIGAGKSSILDELASRGHFVFKEDLNSWGWCLVDYYNDQKRWAFTLQMAVLDSMASQYEQVNDIQGVVFIERSPAAGLVFARNAYHNGALTNNEFNLIVNMYNKFKWNTCTTFKIDTDVDTCMDRIRLRGRECERDISLNYINQLSELYSHNLYLTHGPRCIELNGNKSISQLADIIEQSL